MRRVFIFLMCLTPWFGAAAYGKPLNPNDVNATVFTPPPPLPPGKQAAPAKQKKPSPLIIKAQILLDRRSFSPGAIDGYDGDNYRLALAAFQRVSGLSATGILDPDTWNALAATSSEPALIEYQLTEADVRGPYVKTIPAALEKKAALAQLSYTGPLEMLAERFHMDEPLLKALNPKQSFKTAGDTVLVANVPQQPLDAKVERIIIDKTGHFLSAFAQDGTLIAFYPASVGSQEKPAPTGSFKVQSVAKNPSYHYNPKFQFKEVKTQRPFVIRPGPNNPVGTVWIDLSAESYGIHGTPEPRNIGKTESHGCVRLTNWDVLKLANMVHKGTVVDFVDSAAAAQIN
jgi:lipoprotein-anchoring transpeptidase ErfK/SrfK